MWQRTMPPTQFLSCFTMLWFLLQSPGLTFLPKWGAPLSHRGAKGSLKTKLLRMRSGFDTPSSSPQKTTTTIKKKKQTNEQKRHSACFFFNSVEYKATLSQDFFSSTRVLCSLTCKSAWLGMQHRLLPSWSTNRAIQLTALLSRGLNLLQFISGGI